MAEYDGSIRISTKIEVKQAEKELKSLESSISKTADKIASLRSKMDALKDTKIPTQEYQNLQKELSLAEKEMEKMIAQDSKLADIDAKIKKLSQSAAEYAAKMKEVAEQKIPTKEYSSATKEVEKLEKSLENAYTRRGKFLETGRDESSRTFKGMEYDIEKLEIKLRQAEQDAKILVETGKAFILGTDTEQYKNLASKYEQVNTELEKQKSIHSEIAQKQAESVQKTIELKSQMNQLVESGKAFTLGTDTEKYAQMSAEMQQLNQQMQSDTERQTELQSALAAEEQRLTEIKSNATVSDQKILDLLERRKQLMAEISDMERAGVGFGYKEYEDANRELEKINSQIKSYKDNVTKLPEQFNKMKDSAKKAFNAASEGAKKSDKSLSGSLKTILKYSLGIRSLYALMNKLRSAVKEGFANLAQFSAPVNESISMLMSSLTQLKNSLATAFAPIVTAVAPLLKSLIDMLSQAATHVGMFIAALTGAKTFTKAVAVQQDYAKSLGKTAGAAKKAAGALAKFDDLDVFQKQDDGGGGAADLSPGDMFEEVPIDQNVPEWLDSILERLRELKNIFMEGFWDGLGDWEYRWESIKESAASIKDSLIDIWTDPVVLSAQYEYQNSVAYMLGSVSGAAASIGLTIATNLVGGIAKYLEQNKERIKKSVISMFDIGAEINQLIADFSKALAFIFEAFASEDAQQFTANLIGIFTNGVMGTFEILEKLARDILNIFIQPFVDNKEEFREALEGFLGVLSEVTGTIKQGIDDTFDKLNEVYDEHFKPFFDSVAQGLSDLVGTFLEVWNTYIQPILNSWAEHFDVLWTEHIQPMIDGFLELLGSLADFLTVFWEERLQPLISWLIEVLGPTVGDICDFVFSVVKTMVALISDIINGIVKIVKGVIDILIGIVKGDWQKVWDGFASVVDGMKTIVKGIVNSIIGIVESLANAVVAAINTVIRALNSLHIDVPDWVTELTGITDFGFNLSEISKIEIPRLATGAVIRGGNPFMAVLGDQPAGHTNIEAPLATIEQAVENVLGRQGYGNEPVPVTINLNYDGETFARVSLSDILSEAARQGLDVDVLGVT